MPRTRPKPPSWKQPTGKNELKFCLLLPLRFFSMLTLNVLTALPSTPHMQRPEQGQSGHGHTGGREGAGVAAGQADRGADPGHVNCGWESTGEALP